MPANTLVRDVMTTNVAHAARPSSRSRDAADDMARRTHGRRDAGGRRARRARRAAARHGPDRVRGARARPDVPEHPRCVDPAAGGDGACRGGAAQGRGRHGRRGDGRRPAHDRARRHARGPRDADARARGHARPGRGTAIGVWSASSRAATSFGSSPGPRDACTGRSGPRSTSARSRRTSRALRDAVARRPRCSPSSRPTATATARSRSAAPRSTAGASALGVALVEEGVAAPRGRHRCAGARAVGARRRSGRRRGRSTG